MSEKGLFEIEFNKVAGGLNRRKIKYRIPAVDERHALIRLGQIFHDSEKYEIELISIKKVR